MMNKKLKLFLSVMLMSVMFVSSFSVNALASEDPRGEQFTIIGVVSDGYTSIKPAATINRTLVPGEIYNAGSGFYVLPGNTVWVNASFSGGNLGFFLQLTGGSSGTVYPLSNGQTYAVRVNWTTNNQAEYCSVILKNTGSTNVYASYVSYGLQ